TRSKRDWSSDVCSSDLGRTGPPARATHRIAPAATAAYSMSLHLSHPVGGATSDGRREGFGCPSPVPARAPRLKRPRPHLERAREIGRASCRERAWVAGG